MKLPQLKNHKWNYSALAFAFPVVAILMIMIIGGYTPFGNYSMLYSDMWHQYYPFFKAFRQALLSGESLLYSWTSGMGMDYLGLISYYLGSPLNLLSVLVPEGWALQYFSLLVPIKLGLASLFFAIFLKKMFGKDDLSLPLFGSLYGMCAWALGYQWNVMWLDSFALLPLVALGTIQLLRDRKFVLYTVALFLSVVINYYIGFFICIFVLLVFICYQVCRCKSPLRLLQDFCRIGVFTVIAIGMTTILTIPALSALQTTHSSVNSYPENFAVNIVTGEAVTAAKNAWSAYKTAVASGEGNLMSLFFTALASSLTPILDGMKQIAGNMNGGIAPTFKEGLPNVYCGVGTILFAFLFLTSKEVKTRDKVCSVLLLVFFMISFILRQLDYIWHGFHFTNMIPYRFSFLFSFVMLYMAYRAFLQRESFQLWQIIVAGVLSVGIMLCGKDLTDTIYLAYNIIFLLLYLAALVYTWLQSLPVTGTKTERQELRVSRERHKRIAASVFAAAICLELVLNTVNFGTKFPYTGISTYPKGTTDSKAVIEYMKDNDNDLFYRAEMTHSQTLNDSALNGYNGISTFTSSANVKVTEFTRVLGYAARNNYNRYCFEESSPVANLFLNLKYMIERDGKVEENSYFDDIYSSGNVHLLENNAYLPLGFLADNALADVRFAAGDNAFTFQNQLFSAATGLEEDVWTVTAPEDLTINPNTTNVTNTSSTGYCSYSNGASGSTLFYTYDIKNQGFMCLDLTMSARNSFTVWKNGVQLYSESIVLPQTLAVCEVVPGDEVEIRITCKANESGSTTIRAAVLNDKVFRAGYDILAASTLELSEFSTTKIAGTVTCNRDGLLYTSIPQNGESWSVTVDGEEAEVILVGDAMVAVKLTEGTHTVSFRYTNKAFTLGLTISLICLLVFAGFVFMVYYYPNIRRKGKPETKE